MIKNSKQYVFVSLFVVAIICMIVMTFAMFIVLSQYSEIIENNIEDRLIVTSKNAAMLVTAEELDQFQTMEDLNSTEYILLRKKLIDFNDENELMFTYIARRTDENRVQYVADTDLNPETKWDLDDYTEIDAAALTAFEGTAASSILGYYTAGWEGVVSAFAPIVSQDGSINYCIGVDIPDEEIVYTNSVLRKMMATSMFVLVIIYVSGILGILMYRRKANASDNASLAKSQFLSRMSHEIRTPMNAIIGLCRMAQNESDPEQVKTHLNKISSSSNYLLELINNVLDLSKIESGKMSSDIAAHSMQELIDNINDIIMPQISAKKQIFEMEINPDLPGHIYCDNMKFNQIFINILSNAVKFTPEGGKISITSEILEYNDDKCKVRFSIKDTGIGIDMKNIDKLFNPFEQENTDTTTKYGGTGLGLSITKHFVEMMDGDIRVESEVGRGSNFMITLWLHIAKEEDVARIPKEIEYVDCNGKIFLVVEDVDINREIAGSVLEGLGASVEFAVNGQEGVDAYLENPEKYDVIFMDIQMPVMDGIEATKTIRSSFTSNAATIPIIAMTANVFKEDIKESIDAGMDEHVGKPFDIDQIRYAISVCLHSKE